MGSALVHNDLFLSYYGDDFTGSADVMESLTFNGIPAALFLEPPTIEEVERFRLKLDFASVDGKIKAFGVAGVARSMSPGQMDEELPPIFEQISKIPADFFQYKACSTFDSAPHIGNIGHAAEIASRYFKTGFIPLVIGAPFLNRFVVFGNLFARVGEDTFRLDRHPTM
ncbi:MAG: four-carbon acid sugar kinase family protein, partial [Bacteroidota bacterium]